MYPANLCDASFGKCSLCIRDEDMIWILPKRAVEMVCCFQGNKTFLIQNRDEERRIGGQDIKGVWGNDIIRTYRK